MTTAKKEGLERFQRRMTYAGLLAAGVSGYCSIRHHAVAFEYAARIAFATPIITSVCEGFLNEANKEYLREREHNRLSALFVQRAGEELESFSDYFFRQPYCEDRPRRHAMLDDFLTMGGLEAVTFAAGAALGAVRAMLP